jgi:alkanesulfonate monooxygenase SsuD/methylene tetrahydromethanopterin reductase-like flavin-dependent oxidoreductase (luciferase family)
MRKLEFGTTGFHAAFEGAQSARLSEDMGFDIQSFGENHARAADCFGEMRDAARATTRIKLACGPVNFVTRNPGVVASSILPIHLLSGARAICGVASGDSAVAAAGLKPQRVAEMERSVQQLRDYLQGKEVRFETKTSRIEWAAGLSYAPLPIEMACSGPKSIAMAARTADRIYLGIVAIATPSASDCSRRSPSRRTGPAGAGRCGPACRPGPTCRAARGPTSPSSPRSCGR